MGLQKVTLPTYSLSEEICNAVSHFLGVPLGILFAFLCVNKAAAPVSAVGGVVFSISVIILYMSSGLYHSVRPGTLKKAMRLIDHSAIFILIVGTALAINIICIYPYNSLFTYITGGISLTLSILGIVLTFIDQEKFRKLQEILYMVVGWTSISLIYPIYKYESATTMTFLLMFGGGIIYMVGMVFYKIGKKKKYFHSIFHLFVLLATIIHFIGIYDLL